MGYNSTHDVKLSLEGHTSAQRKKDLLAHALTCLDIRTDKGAVREQLSMIARRRCVC
jgi:hypothetical protein